MSEKELVDARAAVRRLTIVFAVTYLAQGIGTQFGIISQPVQYFMKEGLHLSAPQVSSYLAVLMMPWVLKPFYGIVCDCVPLFGYRRKSYIVLSNLLAGAALLAIGMSNSLNVILAALVCLAVGMAASTAVTVGLAVEAGRDTGNSRSYLSVQTFCYYVALVAASVTGGMLCHTMAPANALHAAAFIASVPVFIASLVALLMVREEKAPLRLDELKKTFVSVKEAFASRPLWLVALFIFCWDFSPSFGVPLYYFESNNLGFSQGTIGALAGWNAAGMAVGAFIYRTRYKNFSMTTQLYVAVMMGTISTLAYLGLSSGNAIGLELLRGCSNAIAILVMYALAAEVCPKRAEVCVMSTLIAVRNLGTEGSTYVGGQLFGNVFHNQLAPLIVAAAATTAACVVLVPFFKRSLNASGAVNRN